LKRKCDMYKVLSAWKASWLARTYAAETARRRHRSRSYFHQGWMPFDFILAFIRLREPRGKKRGRKGREKERHGEKERKVRHVLLRSRNHSHDNGAPMEPVALYCFAGSWSLNDAHFSTWPDAFEPPTIVH